MNISKYSGINMCYSKGSAIAIGNFDGFHLGHNKIITYLKKIAKEKDLISIILTFSPNPRLYFGREIDLINTDDQKKEILEQLNTDEVIMLDFKKIVNMSDEQFLKKFLIEKYNMKYIIMGENFRFGKGREGDIDFLRAMGENWGFGLSIVEPVKIGDQRISSSFIRKSIAESFIENANIMLGREYFIEGKVVEGEKIGTELGFPTINIVTPNTLLPEGVFKSRVEIDGDKYNSITYIGYRPTFSGKEKKVEAHIFNFNKDVYGKQVKIYFQKKVRNDLKFNSRMSLINQIKKDIENLKVDKGQFF